MTHNHACTYSQGNLEGPINPKSHAFGLLEELPWQLLAEETSGHDLLPGPACLKATLLKTEWPCSSDFKFLVKKRTFSSGLVHCVRWNATFNVLFYLMTIFISILCLGFMSFNYFGVVEHFLWNFINNWLRKTDKMMRVEFRKMPLNKQQRTVILPHSPE